MGKWRLIEKAPIKLELSEPLIKLIYMIALIVGEFNLFVWTRARSLPQQGDCKSAQSAAALKTYPHEGVTDHYISILKLFFNDFEDACLFS